MAWYEIWQNNSQGIFDKEKGEYLFIKADNLEKAIAAYDVHIVDVDQYPHCDCCGARWPKLTAYSCVTTEYVLKFYANERNRDTSIKFMNARTGEIMSFTEAADSGAFRN